MKAPAPKPAPHSGPGTSEAVRESAVHERRVWVRLTFACNNHCTFCLDAYSMSPVHRPVDELLAEIQSQAEPKGARLILSGGEASIHPAFLRLIAAGREAGYSWVQTITNGRMFSQEKFARAAILAGLSEATFSLHGHTPELHDKLCGVPGAFEQGLRGLRNLRDSGRVVVNIDIVLTRANIDQLDEILRFFRAEGVHEFDLLHLVPFGRAWDLPQRNWLFFDQQQGHAALRRALTEAQALGDVIWTNRLPPADLEGFEGLIQDPHKLLDEVRGRLQEFTGLLQLGWDMVCKDGRCGLCHMRSFCARIEETLALLNGPRFTLASITLDDDGAVCSELAPEALRALLARQPLERIRLSAAKPSQAAAFLRTLSWPAKAPCVELLLRRTPSPAELAKFLDETPSVTRFVLSDPACFAPLSARPLTVVIPLTKALCAWAGEQAAVLRARGGFEFWMPGYEVLSELKSQSPDPRALLAEFAQDDIVVSGLPRCLHKGASQQQPALDPAWLNAEGFISPLAFAARYVRDCSYAKSHACARCREDANCPGAHLNLLRAFGMGLLRGIDA